MLILQKVAPAGVMVRKGDEIAEFDRQYMLLRLDDYKASVVQSEAGLMKRVADLQISHKSHEQLVLAAKGALDKARLDLKTIPVLSDIDAEKARLAFEQAQAKYQQLLKEVPFVLASEQSATRVSELDLQQAKLELTRAEVNTNKMISKAPIDGLVVMQSMFRGAEFGQIQQGDQLWPGQFYMQVVDPRAMVINATVNQVDVEHVRIGQQARVHFDAYPDLELPAHVESIAAVTKPGTFRAQFVKDVAVRIKIDQMDKRVIPDLSVSAEIVEATGDRTAAIAPLAAVFRDNSNTPYVYVQSDGAWQRRDIQIGIHNNLVAAVKAGVKPGEVLALDRPSSSESPQVSP
jgi:multidrug resistance efflux pump